MRFKPRHVYKYPRRFYTQVTVGYPNTYIIQTAVMGILGFLMDSG